MKIGLLHVGKVADELLDRFEEYPPLFQNLLTPEDPALDFAEYFVLRGQMPAAVDECDAWLITGSAAGVYDAFPWIPKVRQFMIDCRAARVPQVGICFGHQLMAEALGGRAEKSDKGWGCGVHDYAILARPAWMADAPATLSLHAMHQDQVTAVPGDATLLASSPFCRYAMLAYGDPEAPDAISVQPHPEFERPFAQELTALRTGDGLIPRAVGETALATYGKPVHNAPVARWIVSCLQRVVSARKAAA
ncbi:type 1 glutamine amidotransferase [Rhodobacteraceae bacterium NNCM2]|nr:type 1 glutamine amidotransferase [Coraliihabitans acroporae]